MCCGHELFVVASVVGCRGRRFYGLTSRAPTYRPTDGKGKINKNDLLQV